MFTRLLAAASRRSLAVLAAVAIATAIAMIPASPAHAANLVCGDRTVTIYHAKGEARFSFDLCIMADGNMRQAATRYLEIRTLVAPWDNGEMFYYAKLRIRLERYNNTYRSKTCDYTKQANNKEIWYPSECRPDRLYTSKRYGWSADGVLLYDRKGDGRSQLREEIVGTRTIR